MAHEQQSLSEDFESPKVPEITRAAKRYASLRDERMAALEKEVRQKETLIGLMKAHKLENYRDAELTITLESQDKLKVKIRDEEDEE